mgnify:FL=1
MRRFFISPHPTFGNYANPKISKINASPYFWWWYALTLNENYLKLCKTVSVKGLLKENRTDMKTELIVYSDFGDVRYKGCRYVAFTKWWTAKVNDNETRGEYLFAEPQQSKKIQIIKTEVDALTVANDTDSLLVAIPKSLKRTQIDKTLNTILKKNIVGIKGRSVRNPKFSHARYHLNSPLLPSAIKTAFDLYDAKIYEANNGKNLSNQAIAKRARYSVTEKTKTDEVSDKSCRRRILSMSVSRHLRKAKNMIQNTAKGVFP